MAKKKRTGICVKYMKGNRPTDCFWYETDKERSIAIGIGEKEANKNSPAQVFDCVEKGKCQLISTFEAGELTKMLMALLGVGATFGIATLLAKMSK